MSSLVERYLEKYVKRLFRKSDMEDTLKRLDNLTREEARMAIAENLKATRVVGESVKGVGAKVVAFDNRMAGMDDRVAGVGDRVASVDGRVRVVDDKVAEAVRGA